MEKLLEPIKNEIKNNYSIDTQQNTIIIKYRHVAFTYATITLNKKLIYIDMIHVDENARKRGIGKELFDIIIKIGKNLNCNMLGGHVTNRILFNMFIKRFGKDNLKFYRSGLFRDKKITYEEALELLEIDGPMIYAPI